jgi:hypothetical protein
VTSRPDRRHYLAALRVSYAVRRRPVPPARPRALGTRLRPSRPSPSRTTWQRTRSQGLPPRVDREGVIQHSAHPRRRHGPPVRAAVLVEPGSHLSMPVAKTLWRNADPDADGEVPFCDRDHLARVAWYLSVPLLFGRGLHRDLAVLSRSGLRPRDASSGCGRCTGGARGRAVGGRRQYSGEGPPRLGDTWRRLALKLPFQGRGAALGYSGAPYKL